ncbi:hypothetical protein [Nocardia mexicana]|uniref:hypothetical protein n=1 Tax=Nocardia mexicana TaxID=279262 RepID=UPI00082BCB5B|nr:hypothetical protein [Nocardia mexicana]
MQDGGADLKLLGGIHEARLGFGALNLDVVQLGSDLALRERAIGGQVDEVALLFVEALELVLQAGVQGTDAGLFVMDGGVQLRTDGFDEIGW